jgi:hypothetical protein
MAAGQGLPESGVVEGQSLPRGAASQGIHRAPLSSSRGGGLALSGKRWPGRQRSVAVGTPGRSGAPSRTRARFRTAACEARKPQLSLPRCRQAAARLACNAGWAGHHLRVKAALAGIAAGLVR